MTPNYVAGATVNPSVFVQINGNNQVIQSTTSGQDINGISQEWASLAPIPGASTAAAVSGESIKIYGETDVCLLQATSAGWTAGDKLTSDGSGNGITASGSQYYGAVALTTLAAAGLGRVQVLCGKNP